MHPAHFFTRNLINPIKQGELTFPLKICQGNEKHLSIKSLLNDIIYTNYKDNRYKFTVLNSIFNIFLQMSPYCITNIQKNELKIKRNEIMKTCINYLENNINQKITLKLIADNVHLHPNYLCRTFKDYTGQTVFQYLTNLKINKACQLLLTTSMPISQIATECGFESISFFTKKFKELTNTTPKAYAKNKNN
jgi:AraC-like DNA-binding protein